MLINIAIYKGVIGDNKINPEDQNKVTNLTNNNTLF